MYKQRKQSGAQWNIFLYHILLFIGTHLLFVPIFGVLPLSQLGSESYLHYIIDNFVSRGISIYQNSTVNLISSIWKTVLIIHLIVELIETYFPSKKKESAPDRPTEKEIEPSPNEQQDDQKNLGRAWIYLIVAGFLEIIWATALKMDMMGGPVIIVLIISFDLLIKAVKRLGVGTAYAVFTGIGVVGMVIVDMVMFKETITFLKMLLVVLLVIFIIGLRFTSEEQGDLK